MTKLKTKTSVKPTTSKPIARKGTCKAANRKRTDPAFARPLRALREIMREAEGVIVDAPSDFSTNKCHLNSLLRDAQQFFHWPIYKAPDLTGMDNVAVLTDSTMLVAFFCGSDAAHRQAVHLFESLHAPALITRETLEQAATLIGSKSKQAMRMLADFVKTGVIVVSGAAEGCHISRKLDDWLPDALCAITGKAKAASTIAVGTYGLFALPTLLDYEEPERIGERLACRRCGAELSEEKGPLVPCPKCQAPNAGARWEKDETPAREEPEPDNQDD